MTHVVDASAVYIEGVCAASSDVDDDDNELRILLIGKTGVGKSALANIIIGAEVFESEPSPESVTSRCQHHRCRRFGRNIMVVDTPGVFDTKHSQEVILKEISKCYGLTSPGPHAIVMVRRPDRFTEEERETIEIFHKHFGNDLFKYMIMVITSEGSSFREKTKKYMAKTMEIGQKRSQEGTDEEDQTSLLYSVIKMSEDRYLPFNISDDGYTDENQVKDLLQEIDNLVVKNQGKYFTNANFEGVEKCIESYMKEMKNEAEKERDNKISELLESYEHTDDTVALLGHDANTMETASLAGFPIVQYSPSLQRAKKRMTVEDAHKLDLVFAQTARMTRKGQMRNQARDDIQKEKKGILWAIRKLLGVFESAYQWIREQFRAGCNSPTHTAERDQDTKRNAVYQEQSV